MTDRTSLLLGAAVPLGALADYLLRAEPWGVNVPLGVLPLSAALLLLHARSPRPLARGWQWTVGASLAAALLLAWHSSAMLQMTNLLFLLTALLTTVALPALGTLRTASPADLAHAALVYGVHAVFGPVFLIANELRRPAPPSLHPGVAPRLAKGAALALPPLVVFAGLFMAADPVFDHAVHAILDIDFGIVASHVTLAAAVAWLVAGFLRGRFTAEPVPLQIRNLPESLHLGLMELGVVLGSLIVLFAGFLAVQFRYLFGGAPLLDVVPGLTYAQYARSGFFELVTAAAIILPFLLLAQWLFVPLTRLERTIFRLLSLTLVCLVFVLMASAFRRMLLYQNEFGLTELRFFVTAFMAWLALMLLCFSATALRGRRELVLSSGFAVTSIFLLALNIANPDDWIARTNLARAAEGKTFDVRYNARLSSDAVPALIQNLSALNEPDRHKLLEELSCLERRIDGSDWRSWTLSRAAASDLFDSLPRH